MTLQIANSTNVVLNYEEQFNSLKKWSSKSQRNYKQSKNLKIPLECTKPSTYHMGWKFLVWSFAYSFGDDLIWAINTKSTANPNIPASQGQVAFPWECTPTLLPQQESTARKVHSSNNKNKNKKQKIMHFKSILQHFSNETILKPYMNNHCSCQLSRRKEEFFIYQKIVQSQN